MKTLICIPAVLFLLCTRIFSQVVVNEIMYAPSDATNEWFELFNTSNDPVNLQNWKWKDATSTIRTITTQNINLSTNGYIVICEDSVKFKNQFPGFSRVLIQTPWNVLNNGGDNLILINPFNVRIDSITYQSSWGGNTGGFSLERINPDGASNNSTNWGTSIDPQHATPGRKNSITPKPNDLILELFTITPAFPVAGETLQLNMILKNIGLNAANDFSLNLYEDLNLDSIPEGNELLNSQAYQLLNQGDSLISNYAIQNIDTGLKQYIAKIKYSVDDDTLNNKLIRRVYVNNQSGGSSGIVINEFMYAPVAPEPEWVEIYNGTPEEINLKNWKISDSTSQNNPITITSSEKIIHSNDYFIIAKNNEIFAKHPALDTNKLIILSSLPILNNDKDKIVLFNNQNLIIDNVSYKSTWGGLNGHSLERKSPSAISNDSANWATSIDCEHSSPARINSIVNGISYKRNDLTINEIMYDPLTSQAEWLEFFNTTETALNLAGWNLKDLSDSYSIADTCTCIINPGGYLILAKDSSILNKFSYLRNLSLNQKVSFNKNLSLNNDGEPLVISDLFSNIIDSVYYHAGWHNSNIADAKGISLERINPEFNSNDKNNWSSSADISGGTPGLQNSIYTKNLPSNSTITILPNPFSPDGDGFEDFTLIKYKLPFRFAQMRIRIYDIKGRLVKTLSNNQVTGSEGTIIFNGFGDDNQVLRIGIYILIIEAVDDKGGNVDEVKAPLVVAGKL